MKTFYNKYKRTIYTILGIIFVFLLWVILSLTVNSSIIPLPSKVFMTLFSLLGKNTTYLHILYTLVRLLVALIVSFVLALILGVLSASFTSFYTFLHPLVVTLKTVPTASIILILISLTKFQFAPIYVTFLITFPLIYEAVVTGLTIIDENIINALKLDGENAFGSLMRVKLPLAWPSIRLGFIQSLGLGMKVMIMSEIISGARGIYGIGFALRLAQEDVLYDEMFAYTILAVLLIGIIEIILYFTKKIIKKA